MLWVPSVSGDPCLIIYIFRIELILLIFSSLASHPHVVRPFSKQQSSSEIFGNQITRVYQNYKLVSLLWCCGPFETFFFFFALELLVVTLFRLFLPELIVRSLALVATFPADIIALCSSLIPSSFLYWMCSLIHSTIPYSFSPQSFLYSVISPDFSSRSIAISILWCFGAKPSSIWSFDMGNLWLK